MFFYDLFSTIPGYVAWRNTARGSWFVQAFCSVLKAEWDKRDFVSLLTRVNWTISMEYGRDDAKQSSCFLSNLTRDLFFNQKEAQ